MSRIKLPPIILKGNDVEFDIKKTCCFSGHRPERLIGLGDTTNIMLKMVLSVLYLDIQTAIEEGYQYFITGMAKGIDLWAARCVMALKCNKYPHIEIGCAIPYRNQKNSLKGEWLGDYEMTYGEASKAVLICDGYTSFCMNNRNQYMVDNSSKLIAVLQQPGRSGTRNTIEMAKAKGIDTKVIDVNRMIQVSGYDVDSDPTYWESMSPPKSPKSPKRPK